MNRSKRLSRVGNTCSGLDLGVGGSAKCVIYDTIVPNVVNDNQFTPITGIDHTWKTVLR